MRRFTRLVITVIACVPMFGMTCDPPLTCGNPLDGSEFGFAIQFPPGIDCDASLPSPNEIIRGFVTYRVAGSDTQIIVIAANAANSDDIDVGGASQGDCNDLGDYTNANGLTFERCMFTGDQGVSYAGFAAVPNGDIRLLVSIVAASDDPSFPGLLESLLDGVSFPG